MLKQAQELYYGIQDMALDHENIKKGMELSIRVLEAKLDISTHMLRLQRERTNTASRVPNWQDS